MGCTGRYSEVTDEGVVIRGCMLSALDAQVLVVGGRIRGVFKHLVGLMQSGSWGEVNGISDSIQVPAMGDAIAIYSELYDLCA